jgi:hypothetical protein
MEKPKNTWLTHEEYFSAVARPKLNDLQEAAKIIEEKRMNRINSILEQFPKNIKLKEFHMENGYDTESRYTAGSDFLVPKDIQNPICLAGIEVSIIHNVQYDSKGCSCVYPYESIIIIDGECVRVDNEVETHLFVDYDDKIASKEKINDYNMIKIRNITKIHLPTNVSISGYVLYQD